MVHGAPDVRGALGSVAAHSLALLSGPGAAGYAGAGWFAGLVADARAEGAVAVLDCADLAGRVLEAASLAPGIDAVVFTGDAARADRLEAILAERGMGLLRARPEAREAGLPRPTAPSRIQQD